MEYSHDQFCVDCMWIKIHVWIITSFNKSNLIFLFGKQSANFWNFILNWTLYSYQKLSTPDISIDGL